MWKKGVLRTSPFLLRSTGRVLQPALEGAGTGITIPPKKPKKQKETEVVVPGETPPQSERVLDDLE